MKKHSYLSLFLLLGISSCSTTNHSAPYMAVQLIHGENNLVGKGKVLGRVYTDTRGNPMNFMEVAETALKKQAHTKYRADTVVLTREQLLPWGRVVLEGTALKLYPEGD